MFKFDNIVNIGNPESNDMVSAGDAVREPWESLITGKAEHMTSVNYVCVTQ